MANDKRERVRRLSLTAVTANTASTTHLPAGPDQRAEEGTGRRDDAGPPCGLAGLVRSLSGALAEHVSRR